MFLKKIELQRNLIPSYDQYPFSIPTIKSLEEIELQKQVTFFCWRKWFRKIDPFGSNC